MDSCLCIQLRLSELSYNVKSKVCDVPAMDELLSMSCWTHGFEHIFERKNIHEYNVLLIKVRIQCSYIIIDAVASLTHSITAVKIF